VYWQQRTRLTNNGPVSTPQRYAIEAQMRVATLARMRPIPRPAGSRGGLVAFQRVRLPPANRGQVAQR
jgi:hypothetical protein